MIFVQINSQYDDLTEQLLKKFRDRGFVLSDYAKGLLILSVDAWMEDIPPKTKRKLSSDDLSDYAIRIVDGALEDPHVKKNSIKFSDLFVALSDSAKNVLSNDIDDDKGFGSPLH